MIAQVRSSVRTKVFSPFIAAAALGLLASPSAQAQGDLLVAPTRVVLNGGGGAEVILSNVGEEVATYRIGLELRRMGPDGEIEEIAEADANAAEKAVLAMVRYAPRRITLQPNQPQSVRLSARPGPDLPDGEYRAHVSFKAVPDPTAAAKAIEQKLDSGLTIRLTPVYGITIPLIVRKGQLEVTASLANPRVERKDDQHVFHLNINRKGGRSVFGDLKIKAGGKPVYEGRGFAVYPEIDSRTVTVTLSAEQAAALHGPVRIEYSEPQELGGKLIAALDARLP